MKKRIITVVTLAALAIIIFVVVGYSFLYLVGHTVLMSRSGSMIPTINPGDILVVQGGFTINDINAAYGTGDIICFHKPRDPDELIVHRAVEKHTSYLKTKGDNNLGLDPWEIRNNDLVGKVLEVNSLPVIIFTNSIWFIIIGAVFIAASILIFMSGRNEKTEKPPVPIPPE